MKITSRQVEDDATLDEIRGIIGYMSFGAISEDGEIEPGTNLVELTHQLDVAASILLDTMEDMENDLDVVMADNETLLNQLNSQREIFETIEAGVGYDEELDEVTGDMMVALLASGAAEATFDGEISFVPDVTISKADLKPIVMQVIENWIRLKIK